MMHTVRVETFLNAIKALHNVGVFVLYRSIVCFILLKYLELFNKAMSVGVNCFEEGFIFADIFSDK